MIDVMDRIFSTKDWLTICILCVVISTISIGTIIGLSREVGGLHRLFSMCAAISKYRRYYASQKTDKPATKIKKKKSL